VRAAESIDSISAAAESGCIGNLGTVEDRTKVRELGARAPLKRIGALATCWIRDGAERGAPGECEFTETVDVGKYDRCQAGAVGECRIPDLGSAGKGGRVNGIVSVCQMANGVQHFQSMN
jgi:hypothetical protein